VAADVDFWSLYVGGSCSFTGEIANSATTPCEPVDLDLPLETEN
jgi:hypothetical protein